MLKKILKDSLPTIISLTLSGMYSVIDGLFIGKAAGDIGLAAINLAWPITAVITAVGIGIGSGGSVLVSHYRGQGNTKESQKATNHTMTLLFLAGMGMTILLMLCYPGLLRVLGAEGEIYQEAYRYSEIIVRGAVFQVLGTGMLPILRNMDMAIAAMGSMITGLFVNIGVNYWLMFEAGMGIRGAAWGTITAQGVVVCISLFLLCRRQKLTCCLDKRLFLDTAKLGITAFGMSIAPSVTLIFTNWQCLRYGGGEAVACYAVISYITFPVQYMLSGVGEGTQPLMSYYHGAGKEKEVAWIRRIAYRLAVGTGALSFLLVMLFAPYMGGWFGLSAQAAEYFQKGIRISAAAFPILGIVKFNTAYLNGTLQMKKAAVLTYAESLVVAPALLYLLPVFGEISGVWSAFPLTALCMLLMYQGIRERK